MLGAFSLTYGFVVKAVNSGTKFYMVWMGIGILCLLWALLIQLKWWKKIPGWIRGLFIVLVILCAGATACGMGLIFTEFDAEGPEGLDYVVVLGAQVRADGPSVILKYRLDAAADYLKKNPGTVCIVTGGQGYNEPYPEAVGMKDYLVQQGIEEERILTEELLATAAAFLRSNLNLSDTARQLHIHRNTLVYRLDKVQRQVGLDLRKFEDAVTFKLLYEMRRCCEQRARKQGI